MLGKRLAVVLGRGEDVGPPEKQSRPVAAGISDLRHKYVAHERISRLHISRELAEARRRCNIVCMCARIDAVHTAYCTGVCVRGS